MSNKKQNSNYLFQGAILASASIVVRVIGLLYRIPLGRIIGDVGNNYYSCAFEIYSLILLISSYSLPLAVSKIVSARIGTGDIGNIRRILRCALAFGAFVGILGAVVAYFGADYLTGTVLNTPEGALCLRVLAPCILIMGVLGVIRGFFQGHGNMIPTAISQILEQIVNAVVAVAAAWYLYGYGQKIDAVLGTETAAPAYGASGSTLGTTLGALTAFLFLAFLLVIFLEDLNGIQYKTGKKESYGSILMLLILTILPVIFSTAIYNLNSIIDQGLFKALMEKLGTAKKEIDVSWGIYSGKYKLLCNVPIALASAMASSTIPNISKKQGNYHEIRKSVEDVIRFTMVISIPCAFGLGIFGPQIIEVLWPGTPEIAGQMMIFGSTSVIFYSLSTLTNGILQGINQMKLPVIHAAISLVLHIGLLYLLVGVFHMGVMGVVISYIFFGVLMCVLNNLAIRKYLNYHQEILKTFLIPLIASVVMSIISRLLYQLLTSLLGAGGAAMLVSLAAAVLVAVIVYFAAVLAMGGLTEKELLAFPKGHVLVKAARKLHFRI